MSIHSRITKAFYRAVDQFYSIREQPLPQQETLKKSKIVSHRGEHGNGVVENSLAAFDKALEGGVWGIEFDVRWTKDLHPVVFHDHSCNRMFGLNISIAKTNLRQLRNQCPLIPTLEEVIKRYGEKMHLMVDLKNEPYPKPTYQNKMLADMFSKLQPIDDFHLLSTVPSIFKMIVCMPKAAFLPVSRFNMKRLSTLSIRERYGGILGHFAMISKRIIQKHLSLSQKVGTGYVSSTNCFLRELNRNVEWIFSNNAVSIQETCRLMLQQVQ